MRLLASTDFALRALILLAKAPPGEPVSVETLSRQLGNLSRNHLHKIVQNLAALGIVRTIRGTGGGVVLVKAPSDIGVGWLARELEGDQPVVECFRADGGACTLSVGCRLRGYIGEAVEDFYQRLDRQTIADCLPRSHARPKGNKRAKMPA